MPDILEKSMSAASTMTHGQAEVVIGTLAGIADDASPLVDWVDNPLGSFVPAMTTTAPVGVGDIGRQVALLFAGGDPSRPIIVGLIRQLFDNVVDATEAHDPTDAEKTDSEFSISSMANANLTRHSPIDRSRVVLTSDKEIVLQCGKASITLTRAGKVIIRGEHIVSRSSGANQIKGSIVSLN